MSICDDDDDGDEEMTVARWTLPRRRATSVRHPHTVARGVSVELVAAAAPPRRPFGDGTLALGTQETTPPRGSRSLPPPVPPPVRLAASSSPPPMSAAVPPPVPRVGRPRHRMAMVPPMTPTAPETAPSAETTPAAMTTSAETKTAPRPPSRRGLRLASLLLALASLGAGAAAYHAPERVVALYRDLAR